MMIHIRSHVTHNMLYNYKHLRSRNCTNMKDPLTPGKCDRNPFICQTLFNHASHPHTRGKGTKTLQQSELTTVDKVSLLHLLCSCRYD